MESKESIAKDNVTLSNTKVKETCRWTRNYERLYKAFVVPVLFAAKYSITWIKKTSFISINNNTNITHFYTSLNTFDDEEINKLLDDNYK